MRVPVAAVVAGGIAVSSAVYLSFGCRRVVSGANGHNPSHTPVNAPPPHQADGTLDQVLSDEAVLARMLEPLGGGEKADKDDNVREALAEAIAVLVSGVFFRSIEAFWLADSASLGRCGGGA
jgi:hypothetical protein